MEKRDLRRQCCLDNVAAYREGFGSFVNYELGSLAEKCRAVLQCASLVWLVACYLVWSTEYK